MLMLRVCAAINMWRCIYCSVYNRNLYCYKNFLFATLKNLLYICTRKQ